MYYTIYKITNQINGKYYIGSHKTNDLNDNYMGSGKYLMHAQKKHGLDKFTKEILFVFDNPEEMYAMEATIVNDEFIAEENTYNLKRGGFGGWDYNNTIEGQKLREHMYDVWRKAGTSAFLKAFNNDEEFRQRHLNHMKVMSSNGLSVLLRKYPDGVFYGRKHTEETKQKMKKPKNQGSKNSQYGTMWITNGTESKKIKKDDLVPDGWRVGRKIKAV